MVESSSDSELDEQKSSSGITTPIIMAPKTYYYQLTGRKHVLVDQTQDTNNPYFENGNETSNTIIPENVYGISSSISNPGSSIVASSNLKPNVTGNQSAKMQTKKYANSRTSGWWLLYWGQNEFLS